MPFKGCFNPSFNFKNIDVLSSPATPNEFITVPTDSIVLNNPQKVPNKPRKTSSPIIYLNISLLSSNRDETPSNIVPREFADKDGFSLLSSDRTAATGARSVGFIFKTTLAGIKLSFLFMNLSHLASLLKRTVCRKEKITPKTKAIMPIHYGGLPADLDEINKIAKQNRLKVIEDAAHALGSTYKGKPIGSISDFTAFSFQAIKQVTAGDGGALCCKKISDYKRAKRLRWFGIDREASKVSILGERVFEVDELGFKYHMNDLAASLALGNLSNYSSRLKRVRSIANKYTESLKSVAGVKLLETKQDRESSYWLYTLLVNNRKNFIKKMLSKGIPVSVVHQGIDRFKIFNGKVESNINQRKFDQDQICIPIHSGLTNNDIDKVIGAVKEGW